MTSTWQVQEAKAALSTLIRSAETDGPQTITRNGKTVAVVLSHADFEILARARNARLGSIIDFFESWPKLELSQRDNQDRGREVDF